MTSLTYSFISVASIIYEKNQTLATIRVYDDESAPKPTIPIDDMVSHLVTMRAKILSRIKLWHPKPLYSPWELTGTRRHFHSTLSMENRSHRIVSTSLLGLEKRESMFSSMEITTSTPFTFTSTAFKLLKWEANCPHRSTLF